MGKKYFDNMPDADKDALKASVGVNVTTRVVPASVNLFDKDNVTINKSLDENGEEIGLTNRHLSEFIEVRPSCRYYKTASGKRCEYDENYNYIIGSYADDSDANTKFWTKPNTKYIRIVIYYTHADKAQLGRHEEIDPLNYIPYSSSILRVVNEAHGDSALFYEPISSLNGKRVLFIGESTSEGDTKSSFKYQLQEAVNLKEARTHAYGGVGALTFIGGNGSDIPALTVEEVTGIDAIVCWLGINDRSFAIGDVDDIHPTDETMCGVVNWAISQIYTLLAAADNLGCKVIFMNPHIFETANNDSYTLVYGRTDIQTAQAIYDTCSYRGVKCIDINKISGINQYTWDKYCASSVDHVHLGAEGQKLIANILKNELEPLFAI